MIHLYRTRRKDRDTWGYELWLNEIPAAHMCWEWLADAELIGRYPNRETARDAQLDDQLKRTEAALDDELFRD